MLAVVLIIKQNLNGRETEDELFEAGIKAGVEETEGKILEFAKWVDDYYYQGHSKNSFARSQEDFMNKSKIFTLEQLLYAFIHSNQTAL